MDAYPCPNCRHEHMQDDLGNPNCPLCAGSTFITQAQYDEYLRAEAMHDEVLCKLERVIERLKKIENAPRLSPLDTDASARAEYDAFLDSLPLEAPVDPIMAIFAYEKANPERPFNGCTAADEGYL